MNQLLEFSPLLAFFAVFEWKGIYWATGSFMIACVLLLIIHRARSGSFKTMHLVTTALVLPLGSATLVLHDPRFIQWKPTVLLGLGSIAFLGSMFIGRQPLVRRMLGAALDDAAEISARAWSYLNAVWVLWLAALAWANIYIARNFAEGTWVHFKVIGIPVATFIFMLPQVLWLSSKMKADPPKPSSV